MTHWGFLRATDGVMWAQRAVDLSTFHKWMNHELVLALECQQLQVDLVKLGCRVQDLEWDWFTYDGRTTSMGVTALTFYALTGDARFRLDINASFRSDIISDLYWSINMFESFNSLPPTGQKKNDFGISAAIGWTF